MTTLSIKIGYSEPTRAESREGSSRSRELSGVTYCSILTGWRLGWRNARFWLADDSVEVMFVFAESRRCCRVGNVLRYGAESRKSTQCIKIGNACIKIWSRKPSQGIKIGDACIKIRNRVFSALCDNFRHCEIFFEKKFNFFWCPPPALIFTTPADVLLRVRMIYFACG